MLQIQRANSASAIAFTPTSLVTSTDVQAALAEVGVDARMGTVNAADYASVDVAAAACVSGNLLYIPPGTYNTSQDVSVPAGVHVYGYGASIRFTADKTFKVDDPDSTYRGFTVNGNNTSNVPLRFGTGAAGSGAKVIIADVRVTQALTTAIEIQNLQNSQIFNLRISNSSSATTGLLIDNGSKNLSIFGFWAADLNGPYCKITTAGGSQRTSKVYFWGGLFEIGGTTDGFRLEDCEQVYLNNLAINAGSGAVNGVHCVAGGNRSGTGAKMPSSISVKDCVVTGFDNGIHIAGSMLNAVLTGGCIIGGNDVQYRVEHANGRIKECYPHLTESTVRYASTAGVDETTAIQRDVAPINVPITTANLTWTDMPAAATELGGSTDYRKWQDLAQMRFVRLTARVKVAGVAGSKLQLKYRTTDGLFSSANAIGTSEVELAIDATGSVKSAWVPLASGAQAADVLVIVGGISGDGAADPQIASITAQFA